MCLAIPAMVVKIGEGDLATVDLGGLTKEISLALVEGVGVGDWIILHSGFALARLDPEEAARTLELLAEASS